ncbi:MAG: hypothetical protein H6852_04025 [Geminicoccaceae bacterium]|jgi:hypothetical protein|nr:hypothetical protein [Geminicoccaceae bacterium]
MSGRKAASRLVAILWLLALGLLANPAAAQHWSPDFRNSPARTAQAFKRDVFIENLRRGNRAVVLGWFRHGPGFTFNIKKTAKAAGYSSTAPAYADILGDPEANFLKCEGGPFALCFYSGPEGPLPCDTSKYDTISECTCTVIDHGLYFVDILGILNLDVYEATVAACGPDGSGCPDIDDAPVCDVVNEKLDPKKKMFPADMISVFSLDGAAGVIGQSNCESGKYAGCMTAPCYYPNGDEESDTVQCLCPNYSGPFQIGQDDKEDMCSLGNHHVWSAAYTLPGGNIIPDGPPLTHRR